MRAILVTFLVLTCAPIHAIADTINGCVDQRTGRLRIVGVAGQCRDREVPISWNSEGPAGPQGEQGPDGPKCEAAPAPPRFELVSFTAATFQGDTGFLGFNTACAAEFRGSRFCNTTEVAETVNVPAFLSGIAWVNPDHGSPVVAMSGAALEECGCLSGGNPGGRWNTNNSSMNGATVSAAGHFRDDRCDILRSVACCAPAP
jgi:hypothetical protein